MAKRKPNHSHKIELRPIKEAPEVAVGDELWPCLITPGKDSDYVIGGKNDAGWFGDDGSPLEPKSFAYLGLAQKPER
jgi:hypothetical protein